MKAGTAQKMILNMITTAAMIRLGRVYKNRMVDLVATSEKLRERSKGVLMELCDLNYRKASELLVRADGSVKVALVMELTSRAKEDALRLLKKSDGFVRKALILHNKQNNK